MEYVNGNDAIQLTVLKGNIQFFLVPIKKLLCTAKGRKFEFYFLDLLHG